MNQSAFTASQLAAVDVSAPFLDACVVAGPGSGKTTVLVEYFRRLVEAGADPLRILAITFTEKAAGNMRAKLAKAFREQPQTLARLERAWISTIHGFCTRILYENAVSAGIDPEFSIADANQAWRIQRQCMDEAMDALLAANPAATRALMKGLASGELGEAALSAYDAMRCAGAGVEDLAEFPTPLGVSMAEVCAALEDLRKAPLNGWNPTQREHMASIRECGCRIIQAGRSPDVLEELEAVRGFEANLRKCKSGTPAYALVKKTKDLIGDVEYTLMTQLYARQRELLLELFHRFDRLYRECKREAGLLDFADLEEHTVRLLELDPETRARIQSQFDHILMDEYQDTNGQQAKLIRLLRAPGRFYAVGDINQSIFGFRHAEPEVFWNHREEVFLGRARLVELAENFRSRPDILSAVETIMHGAPGIAPHRLIAKREFDRPKPLAVEVMQISGADIEEALAREARWVARRILELLDDAEHAFQFRDVAVLVRNTEVLGEFSAAFDRAGIPYLINSGKGFYQAREVNDLTHLLRVIANPRDELSVAAVLRSPLVRVSDEALLGLRLRGENIGAALLHLGAEAQAEFDAEDYRRLCRFRDRLRDWRVRRNYVAFDRLLLAAIDDCGYTPESGSRGAANVDKFLGQAREAAARMTLDEFVEELAVLRAANLREPDAPPEDFANAVNVMTVHAAKGLEFPIVFVAALHKGVDTDLPVVAFSRRYGLGGRWRNPVTNEDKDDLFQHSIREERKTREIEESHRLFFVAMTRAEQHLVLSFSRAGKQPGNWARVVVEGLGLKFLDSCNKLSFDEEMPFTAPGGATWRLRIFATGREPELRRARPAVAESSGGVELIKRPQAVEQQDTNATVTGLTAFANCPRQYYLGHYLGFEGGSRNFEGVSGGADLSAAELGTQVHSLLAGNPVANPTAEALRLAETFRQSTLGRRAARASRIEREFNFLMAIEDLVIRGQVDLWFEEGGELTVVDYKTDAVSAAEAHQRAIEYAPQLRLYALAVERAAGRAPDRAWLYFLRPNKAIELDLTPQLLESPDQLVRDFQQAQSALDFPLREGRQCRRCPFFQDLCPAPTASGLS
jgi:ATP-dependent helicase/nuclease subunit A